MTRTHACLLTLAFFAGPLTAVAETWPVKEFEVFVGKPATSGFALPIGSETVTGENAIQFFSDLVDLDDEQAPTIPISPEQIATIEQYLGEVARMLEEMGFKPPDIEPVVRNAAGRPAYRVYYFDFNTPATSATRRSSDCGRARPTVWINGRTFLDGNRISPKDFQDLGHEIFHGVQASYPLFIEHCEDGPGGWITEGTAQALGADLAAWSTRKINYPHRRENAWPVHRWGLRPFDKPLFVKDGSDNAYAASAFWRYLGEYLALSGGAGTIAVKPDYSYLIDFFNAGHEEPINDVTAMYWLNKALRDENGKFELGLHRLYPNFITTFAAYGGTRVNPDLRTSAENREVWLKNVFLENKCPGVPLTQQAPSFTTELNVAPIAARCFRVEWPRGQSQDLQVRATGPDKERLRALTLGTEEGGVIAQPALLPTGGNWSATWIVNLDPGSEPVELIVSNAADEAAYTRRFQGSVSFDLPYTRNNLATYGPMPPQNGSGQSSGREPSALTKDAQDARVGEKISGGLDEMNPNMVHGLTIGRRPDQSPCEDAFIDLVCGPVTTISLQYVPGILGTFEQSTGRGGVFGQFASALSGIAKSGIGSVSESAFESMQRIENTEGTRVSITIPLIDYGFTGSFSNASLEVNAPNGETYQSIGPGDIQPGPGVRFPLAGKVTIEEYSPWQARGSFSGHLVNVDQVEISGDDPTLPVHRNIEGTFNIVAAWRGDQRVVVEAAEPAVQSVIDDVREMTGGLGFDTEQLIQSAQQQGAPAPASAGSGSSSGQGGAVTVLCDCSCNTGMERSPACEKQCGPTLAACAGAKATAASLVFVPPSVPAGESAGKPFLRTLPDACDVLDEAAALTLLDAAAVEPNGPREVLPKVTSQCGYRAAANRSATTNLVMLFTPLVMVDSYNMPRDELRIMAAGFSMLTGAEPFDVEGVGNIAFGFSDPKTTTLKIYTGIYGTGGGDDVMAVVQTKAGSRANGTGDGDLVSELVLTYSLMDETQSEQDRMKKLYELTRSQVQALQELAHTTHEGQGKDGKH